MQLAKISINYLKENKAIQNIFSIGILRAGNILIQLLLIPVSIRYISSQSYGLWLTLSSMVTWLNIMDIGLSTGLRNKITEFNARGDKQMSRIYVSTTYGLLGIISLVGCGLGAACAYLVDWSHVLTIPSDMNPSQVQFLILIIISSFFLTFLLKPIASVAYAVHKPYIEYLILLISNFANLALIYVLVVMHGNGSITSLALVFCFTPIVATFFLSWYFFSKHFRDLRPGIKLIQFKHSKDLMSLSGKFFIIQIAATVIFATNNFIISHYLGNEDVTLYNIAFRYFNTMIILQSMMLVPFWAIFTENYILKRQDILSSNLNKLVKMTVVLGLLTIGLLIASNFAYRIWLKDLVVIPFSISFWMCIYTILTLVSAVYTTFINGTGRVQIQMYSSICTSILHIPVAILLIKYFNLGVIGLIITSSTWLLLTIPLRIYQSVRIQRFEAKPSIWNK